MKRALTLMVFLAGVQLALLASTAAAAFPGKNGRIAFTASHDFTGQCPPDADYPTATFVDEAIFTMNPDGSRASQVTATHHNSGCTWGGFRLSGSTDDDPSYSPSGKRLGLTSIESDPDYGALTYVGVIHVDGTNGHWLTHSFASSRPAFSPDGEHIAYVENVKIAVMRSDGSHKHFVTDPVSDLSEGDPSFFPNGKRIVFVSTIIGSSSSRSNISAIRLDGSHRHRLTARSSASLNSPDVSPDGRRIVFGRGTGVYVMRADGSHQRRLADGSSPVFSPNGKRIAFARDNAIFVMTANGSHEHAVIPSPLPFGVADPSQLALGQPSWGPRP